MSGNKYIKVQKAAERLGVHKRTLYNWGRLGKIEMIRTESGHRLFNVDKYLKENEKKVGIEKRRKICYCRVSTLGQKDDLKRQVKLMKKKYPDYELIEEIGSGINFKRKGFNKILDYAIKGEVDEVVIAYKDRLCRIGYELVERIIKEYSDGKIIIVNEEKETPEEEIVKDLMQIINVYSAKLNGKRKYRNIVDNP